MVRCVRDIPRRYSDDFTPGVRILDRSNPFSGAMTVTECVDRTIYYTRGSGRGATQIGHVIKLPARWIDAPPIPRRAVDDLDHDATFEQYSAARKEDHSVAARAREVNYTALYLAWVRDYLRPLDEAFEKHLLCAVRQHSRAVADYAAARDAADAALPVAAE